MPRILGSCWIARCRIRSAAWARSNLQIDAGARELLLAAADGDARRMLNLLETAADLSAPEDSGRRLDVDTMRAVIGSTYVRFDKGGENFYDQISALHKSVRGSDPDAALYWLCRMLAGGCDPLYIARRALRMASEDIGNADPRALTMALEACAVYERLGSPEGELAIAQAIVFMACAAKSNAVYTAYKAAAEDAASLGSLEVPLHLRNAPTRLMKEIGYGKGYRYAHDEPGGYAAGERYFPDEMPDRRYYVPAPRGLEIKIGEALNARRERDRQARGAGGSYLHYDYNGYVSAETSTEGIHRARSEAAAQRFDRGCRGTGAARLCARRRRLCRAGRAAQEPCKSKPIGCAPSAMPTPRRWATPSPRARMRRPCSPPASPWASSCKGVDRQLEAHSGASRWPCNWACRICLHASVPDGRDEAANVEVRRWGVPRQFDFRAQGSRGARRAPRAWILKRRGASPERGSW